MKNKFTLLWVLFAAMFQSAQAQQEPLFAQYNTNAYLINPAVAGSMGGHSIRAFHRWQWVSFPGAPKTFGVTYQGLIKNQHGVGGLIFADQTGPLTRVGGKASYAFHIPLADNKYRLSLGLAGRYVFNRIRTNAITFIQQNDQAVADLSRGVHAFDAEFGVFFHSPKFYVGAAAPNLLQAKLDYGNTAGLRNPIGYGYVHYFGTAGYRFTVGDANPKLDSAGKKIGVAKAIDFEPSIMVKYVRGAQVQIDGGLMAFFLERQLGFGLFYRSPGFISAQARFMFDNHIPVVLAFDVATSRFQQYSAGATEVMAGYDFSPTNGGMFAPPPPKKE